MGLLPACRESKGTRRANSMLDSVSRLDAAAGGVSFARLKRVRARCLPPRHQPRWESRLQ